MRWTTMGLSAGHQYAQISATSQPPADIPPIEAARKNRIASLWIPAILGIGLVTAFAYLSVRIVTARSEAKTAPVVEAKAPAAAPVAPQAAAPQPAKPKPPLPAPKPLRADFTVINPQAGERYLQVAAVSPHMVLTYVDGLRKMNFEAVVAPGPTADLLRILVGPFVDSESMDQAKAQLQLNGRSPIVRSY